MSMKIEKLHSAEAKLIVMEISKTISTPKGFLTDVENNRRNQSPLNVKEKKALILALLKMHQAPTGEVIIPLGDKVLMKFDFGNNVQSKTVGLGLVPVVSNDEMYCVGDNESDRSLLSPVLFTGQNSYIGISPYYLVTNLRKIIEEQKRMSKKRS